MHCIHNYMIECITICLNSIDPLNLPLHALEYSAFLHFFLLFGPDSLLVWPSPQWPQPAKRPIRFYPYSTWVVHVYSSIEPIFRPRIQSVFLLCDVAGADPKNDPSDQNSRGGKSRKTPDSYRHALLRSLGKEDFRW